jgi:hypothetical protein
MEYDEDVARRTCSLAILLTALSCGGSASESPWPVEPVLGDHGPSGEALPKKEVDTRKLPDSYSKGEQGAAEQEEGAPEDEEEEPLEEEPLEEEPLEEEPLEEEAEEEP